MRHQGGLEDADQGRFDRRTDTDDARPFGPPHDGGAAELPVTDGHGVFEDHDLFEVFEVVVSGDAVVGGSWGDA